MGVKYTVRLTREQAISRIVEIQLEWSRRLFENQYGLSPNYDLVETLEKLNDKRAGGEGFENYLIVETEAEAD